MVRELWAEPGARLIFEENVEAEAKMRLLMGETDTWLDHSYWPWQGPCHCSCEHGDLWEDPVVLRTRNFVDEKMMRLRQMVPPEWRPGGF